MPLLSKQQPQAVARQPIREWAREHWACPAGATGPIRASVQAAYAAAQTGAADRGGPRRVRTAEADRRARRQATRRASSTSRGPTRPQRAELAPLRAMGQREHGIELPANGHIPAEVTDAYEAAQRGQTEHRRPSKQPKRRHAMTTKLSDVGRDLYEQLTARTLYVVDTEFCHPRR